MTLPKLSKTMIKDEYNALKYKKAKLGNMHVTVTPRLTQSQGGSWERGFRFYQTYWAMLIREKVRVIKKTYSGKKYTTRVDLYSTDHGKTWHETSKAAMKSKGKMKLSNSNHKELAFDGIQRLNRNYYGSDYVWKR